MKKPIKIQAVLAQNLAMLRKHHQLSQTEAAKKCGVSQKTISNAENLEKLGRDIELTIIENIAHGFNLTVSELLDPELTKKLEDN